MKPVKYFGDHCWFSVWPIESGTAVHLLLVSISTILNRSQNWSTNRGDQIQSCCYSISYIRYQSPNWIVFFGFEFRSVPVLALVSVLYSSTHSTENQIYSKNYCFLIGSASFDRFFDWSGRVWFGSARLDIWKVGSSPVKKVRVRVRSDSNRTELKRFDFGLCPLHDQKSLLFMFLGSKCPMLFCLLAKQK